MLIQQFVGALCTLLIDRAFRLGTSEPHAIGLSFPRRLLARAALLESLQIDQFPHNHPSCRGFGESGQFEEERVRRKAKTRTGHPGRHCQEVLSNCRAIASKNVFRCAKTNIWCCITAAGKVGSQIVSVSRSYDLSLYLVAVNEFTIRTIPGTIAPLTRVCHFVRLHELVEFLRRNIPEAHRFFLQRGAVRMGRFGDFCSVIITDFRRERCNQHQ